MSDKKVQILPRVLSDLLEIAIDDYEALTRAGKVNFYMYDWLRNDPKKKTCSACLAGGVMLRRGLVTTRIPNETKMFAPNHCENNEDQLFAINDLRASSLASAWFKLFPEDDKTPQKLRDLEYAWDEKYSDKFVDGMFPVKVYREMIKELRDAGY